MFLRLLDEQRLHLVGRRDADVRPAPGDNEDG
jgi:hypothetical protein